jgi:hypothetical protein
LAEGPTSDDILPVDVCRVHSGHATDFEALIYTDPADFRFGPKAEMAASGMAGLNGSLAVIGGVDIGLSHRESREVSTVVAIVRPLLA